MEDHPMGPAPGVGQGWPTLCGCRISLQFPHSFSTTPPPSGWRGGRVAFTGMLCSTPLFKEQILFSLCMAGQQSAFPWDPLQYSVWHTNNLLISVDLDQPQDITQPQEIWRFPLEKGENPVPHRSCLFSWCSPVALNIGSGIGSSLGGMQSRWHPAQPSPQRTKILACSWQTAFST